ncbi:hypothetical protein [Lentzea sp. NBC_00516]
MRLTLASITESRDVVLIHTTSSGFRSTRSGCA